MDRITKLKWWWIGEMTKEVMIRKMVDWILRETMRVGGRSRTRSIDDVKLPLEEIEENY